MDVYLIDYAGKTYELPTLLSWSFAYGSGLPCDAFEVSFPYKSEMLETLESAVRLRAVHKGETVFFGVVDDFEVTAHTDGCRAVVSGRGMAALLLDNEAQAAQYVSATLDTILNEYVYPFGIENAERLCHPPAQAIIVESGESCWRVLEEFLWFGCGARPGFSKEGTLLLGEREGKRFEVAENTCVFDVSLREKRYGVVSEVLVMNKSLGTTTRVADEEFIARGGVCRRVVGVPRRTMYDAMRSTGSYQLKRSREEEFSAAFTVPALFAAFPGDVAVTSGGLLGLKGSFKVGRTRCFANGENAGTEIELTGREV